MEAIVRVAFIMEQHIGHRSYYENLKKYVSQSTKIEDHWVEITYQDQDSIWNKIPLLPPSIRGSFVGRSQARRGLKQPADIFFFNTQVPAVLSGKTRALGNYLLATDITPIQYDRMAKWYGHQPDGDGWVSRFKHKSNESVFRNASRVLPWSSWTAKSLIQNYNVAEEQIRVIPPGVDLGIWQPGQSADRNCFRILFVGGDFYRKGGDLVLKAFEVLRQRFPEMSLELALVTRSMVPITPGVTVYSALQPNAPELVRLYQSSDTFVLPTRAEAFGIAAVEASAAGLPIVATRVGGLTDIVEDGTNGFLVELEEFHALLENLVLLIQNPDLRKEMGQAGRERAKKHFDAAQNATNVINLIVETHQEKELNKYVYH